MAPRARVTAALLLVNSAAGMAVALTLPTIWYQTIGYPEEIYSILGGIRALWDDGTPVLSAVVFAFSLVLPLFKLCVAGTITLRGAASVRAARTLKLLHGAGRWSTLDFWVVGLFVSAVQFSVTRSETRAGIHLFMLAMVAGILATRVLVGALPSRPPSRAPRRRPPHHAWGRVAHLASTLCLLATPALMLMSVKKGVLLRHDLSVAGAISEQVSGGEWSLALGLGAFMILLPAARAVIAGYGHWSGAPPSASTCTLERELRRWSMLDVLVLALFIVASKLSDLATVEFGAGALTLAGAAALGAVDSALLQGRARSGQAGASVPR